MRKTWISLFSLGGLAALALALAPDAHAAPKGALATPLLHGGVAVSFG